jgi:polyferredoxin
MLILPMVFNRELIFPTAFEDAAFMILLVTVVGLIFGRAFCSWGCFFGGQDQLFASLPQKKRWRLKTLKPSYAIFLSACWHSSSSIPSRP